MEMSWTYKDVCIYECIRNKILTTNKQTKKRMNENKNCYAREVKQHDKGDKPLTYLE